MSDWTTGIKRLALQAYESNQPCDVCFGTILSTQPLSVMVEQMKVPLVEAQLVLSDSLKEKKILVTVDGKTGTAVVPAGIEVGNHVILIKKAGGQVYVILAKIGRRDAYVT